MAVEPYIEGENTPVVCSLHLNKPSLPWLLGFLFCLNMSIFNLNCSITYVWKCFCLWREVNGDSVVLMSVVCSFHRNHAYCSSRTSGETGQSMDTYNCKGSRYALCPVSIILKKNNLRKRMTFLNKCISTALVWNLYSQFPSSEPFCHPTLDLNRCLLCTQSHAKDLVFSSMFTCKQTTPLSRRQKQQYLFTRK